MEKGKCVKCEEYVLKIESMKEEHRLEKEELLSTIERLEKRINELEPKSSIPIPQKKNPVFSQQQRIPKKLKKPVEKLEELEVKADFFVRFCDSSTFIPSEIVWSIMLFLNQGTLPSLFQVCRRWGEISKDRNFWNEYRENVERIHNPNFEPDSKEERILRCINENDLFELKSLKTEDFKNTKPIPFRPSWMRKGKQKDFFIPLNFLMYAISKDRLEIVKFFLSKKLFRHKRKYEEFTIDIWTICACFGRKEILKFLLDNLHLYGLKPSFVTNSGYFGKPFSYYGKPGGEPYTPTFQIPNLCFPIFWNDLEMTEILLQKMSLEEKLSYSQSLLQATFRKNQHQLSKMILEKGGYYFETTHFEKVPKELVSYVERSNTIFENSCGSLDSFGYRSRPKEGLGYPVWIKTLTGTTYKILCHPLMKFAIFKSRVEEKVGIPPMSQRIVNYGKILPDDLTMKELGLGYNSLVRLIIQLR